MTVRIHFVDCAHSEVMHRPLKQLIESNFNVSQNHEDPQIVFCGPRPGYEVLQYPHAVRVYAHGENLYPDFNIYDYSFGYLPIDVFDRYKRIPIYAFWDTYQYLVRHNQSFYGDPKTHFCAYVYSNVEWADPCRRDFFAALSEYKFVHAPGICCNNTEPLAVPTAVFFEESDSYNSKIDYLRKFKFCIAFENHAMPGYVTEKLTDALYAGTIPIYWGDPNVGQEFNTKRFINVRDFQSWHAVIDYIKLIDQDDALFKRIVGEPIFASGGPVYSKDDVVRFLRPIFIKPKIRRDLHCWGKIYEKRLKYWADSALCLDRTVRELGITGESLDEKIERIADQFKQLADDNVRFKRLNQRLRKRLEMPFGRRLLWHLNRLIGLKT